MNKQRIECHVLVAGGGTSGICAAIQAARAGVEVVLMSENAWLGGMLTAAGVSAVDGNHDLPSGLWGVFRRRLYDHYGRPEALKTGWVSHTLFEPSVGNRIFHEMARPYENLHIYKHMELRSVLKKGQRVRGARFIDVNGAEIEVQAAISIDATEYGDFMAAAGCAYRLGRDSREESGEANAPHQSDQYIQDLTYVAVLQDTGRPVGQTQPQPPGYDPELFRGCCKEWSTPGNQPQVDAATMLEYGRLPNNKFMINWPIRGNDYFALVPEMSHEQRREQLQHAKRHTQHFVRFIREELGFDHLDYASDEFPGTDRLALIPYIRESRRLKGIVTLTADDIVDPYANPGRALYKSGVAVGDYPIDHHHEPELKQQEHYPSIPAFNVPYGCMVPAEIDGLLVAEKNISVTHLVNGCTRLQPVVMQIGQAAGAAAALCVRDQKQPRDISIRALQQVLLDNGVWLMPFSDVDAQSPEFNALQKCALSGMLKGRGESRQWANRFYIFPERAVTGAELNAALRIPETKKRRDASLFKPHETVTLGSLLLTIWSILGRPNNKNEPSNSKAAFDYFRDQSFAEALGFDEGNALKKEATRRQWAVLLEYSLNPFQNTDVDIAFDD